MARGGRTNFAELAGSVGTNSVIDGQPTAGLARHPLSTPLTKLVANPQNPREGALNVDDLASIAEIQLQPGLGVSRSAYLKLFPEDENTIGDASIVVINGCRRLVACKTYGRTTMDVVIKDEIATSRAALRAAAIRENVERENLDVLEEARAVEQLVTDAGSAIKAAEELGKTPAWVSQRRALLKLAPEIQQALRGGDIAIRVARNLAQVPMEQQVERWQAAANKEGTRDQTPKSDHRPALSSTQIAKTFRRWDAPAPTLAAALAEHLDTAGIAELIAELKKIGG